MAFGLFWAAIRPSLIIAGFIAAIMLHGLGFAACQDHNGHYTQTNDPGAYHGQSWGQNMGQSDPQHPPATGFHQGYPYQQQQQSPSPSHGGGYPADTSSGNHLYGGDDGHGHGHEDADQGANDNSNIDPDILMLAGQTRRKKKQASANQQGASKYKNVCLDTPSHKLMPGPEPGLVGQCNLWADNACCSSEVTQELHKDPHLGVVHGFNFGHCRPLSQGCAHYFRQEMCITACSPNLGPWIDPPQKPGESDHYNHMPICASECHDWFNACINDLTCVVDWFNSFEWDGTTAVNVCPKGSVCRTFKSIFGDARTFCEKIWAGQWHYEDDSPYCLKLFFNPGGDNPNAKVAAYHAERRARAEGHSSNITSAAITGGSNEAEADHGVEPWTEKGCRGVMHDTSGAEPTPLVCPAGLLIELVAVGCFLVMMHKMF